MSSGINWKYRVINADQNEPPISYEIGVEWASGEKDELVVGAVSGLDAVRTAYSRLPGLAGSRQLWLRSNMSSSREILTAAGQYCLHHAAKKLEKKTPRAAGYCGITGLSPTVGEWLKVKVFVHGAEIADHAGVGLDEPFLANWERLAIAAEEYPEQRWGVCTRVSKLRVLDISDYKNKREVGPEEASHVLEAAERWASAVDQRLISAKADVALSHLMDEEVIKAAVAVTRKKGSVSGLRQALRLSGYLA